MDFVPPFCPNRQCPTHLDLPESASPWYIHRGFRHTQVVGPVPKFQCRHCHTGFSSRTFSIDYWVHRTVDYHLVQDLLVGGSGLRQTSRTLKVSTRLIANRHLRLARQSMVLHSDAVDELCLTEPLVLDGFESFAYSQYYPNNLNLLVTSDSQFVLGMTATVLRRKGRMREDQKKKRSELEKEYRAPSNGILKSSKTLFRYGCHLSFASKKLPIEFRTDEKIEYSRAISQLRPYGEWLEEGLLVHHKTSSKAPRTLDNPLFAVNYLDRQLRKDLAEHVRETVRFARRIEHSLERAVIHLAHHNFRKQFRIRVLDRSLTHAEVAGLERQKIEELRESSLRDRAFGWRSNLEQWQRLVWNRETRVPVHPVTPLARHLQTA